MSQRAREGERKVERKRERAQEQEKKRKREEIDSEPIYLVPPW